MNVSIIYCHFTKSQFWQLFKTITTKIKLCFIEAIFLVWYLVLWCSAVGNNHVGWHPLQKCANTGRPVGADQGGLQDGQTWSLSLETVGDRQELLDVPSRGQTRLASPHLQPPPAVQRDPARGISGAGSPCPPYPALQYGEHRGPVPHRAPHVPHQHVQFPAAVHDLSRLQFPAAEYNLSRLQFPATILYVSILRAKRLWTR